MSCRGLRWWKNKQQERKNTDLSVATPKKQLHYKFSTLHCPSKAIQRITRTTSHKMSREKSVQLWHDHYRMPFLGSPELFEKIPYATVKEMKWNEHQVTAPTMPYMYIYIEHNTYTHVNTYNINVHAYIYTNLLTHKYSS